MRRGILTRLDLKGTILTQRKRLLTEEDIVERASVSKVPVEAICPHCERVKFFGTDSYVASWPGVRISFEGAKIQSCQECREVCKPI